MPRVLNAEEQAVLVRMLDQYIKDSDSKLNERAQAWEEAEKRNRSYTPTADAKRKANAKEEKDKYTRMVVPYSYAMMMAAHTYLSSIFLARDPIFQYKGKSRQGQDEVTAAETLVDHNVTSGGLAAPLYFAIYDLLGYGICCVGSYWDEEVISVTSYRDVPVVVNGVEDPVNTEEQEFVTETAGYVGNKIFNVKPKELIIDPRVGFAKFQEGDYIGRRLQLSKHDITKGKYFNKEAVHYGELRDRGVYDSSALVETSDGTFSMDMKAKSGYCNAYEIYVRLVPSEYGLGKNTNKEVWVFTLVNRTTLIGAAPAGWLHGKYPYDIGVAEFDAYTLSSRGFPEIGAQLESTMNWLINSHMYNVEKSVNNEYLYDPTMINQADFLDPAPGKRIRVKPAAYGKDVRQFIHQFQQIDFTKSNLTDLGLVETLFQRLFGINEQMMGAMLEGGRKTATEIRSSNGFGLNRLKVLAEFFGTHFMAPLGNKLLKNCLQMYPEDYKVVILDGDSKSELTKEITVQEITGDFDFAAVDGSLPIDRFAQVALYKELLSTIITVPAIAGRYDIATFFAFITKLAGVKNMESFEIEIASESKIRREVALGNLVVGNIDNVKQRAGAASAARGAGEQDSNVENPPVVSSVGRAG